MNHDVFISYSSKNKITALAMCHVLEQHRIKCWMAPRDIPAGADYGDVIDEAIMACRVFVIIFSEPAAVSQWVKGELNLAFSEEKHIVPYRIDDSPLKGAMRLILNQTHWIEAYPDAESKFDELVTGIARYLDIPTVAEQPRADRTPVAEQPKTERHAVTVPTASNEAAMDDKTSFNVILKNAGQAKLLVVETVKEIEGISISNAMALVNSAPSLVKMGVSKEEAESIKCALEHAGAEVEVEVNWKYHRPYKYKVGDYYNENGREGVVFEVDATGRHGKIVSMKQSADYIRWCMHDEKREETGATDKSDGMKNMQQIMRIADWRENYPAFAWCAEQGEGWYLPAIEELKKFALDSKVFDDVNRTLSQYGGDRLINEKNCGFYWSSSERSDWEADVSLFLMNGDGDAGQEEDCWYLDWDLKTIDYFVRAVAAF